MKIKNIEINRRIDRNDRRKPHWNLNQNHAKCQDAENTLEDIHKTKSIRAAYRKSHGKLRGKYQFC